MSLFSKEAREQRREIMKEKWKARDDEKRMKYVREYHLEDIYTDENKALMNSVIDMSQAKGTIPQFQDQGIKTLYGEQLVLERQNWMAIAQNDHLIKQNDEIIELLKKLSEK